MRNDIDVVQQNIVLGGEEGRGSVRRNSRRRTCPLHTTSASSIFKVHMRNSPLGRGIVGLLLAIALEALHARKIHGGAIVGLGQHAGKKGKPALVVEESGSKSGCKPSRGAEIN